jgi:AraC-like DNA-binding protein
VYAAELAQTVGISQASLQRVFHEWFGMPPARYLLLRRFYIARRRLRSKSADTVTEIASELGFWEHVAFLERIDSFSGTCLRKPCAGDL